MLVSTDRTAAMPETPSPARQSVSNRPVPPAMSRDASVCANVLMARSAVAAANSLNLLMSGSRLLQQSRQGRLDPDRVLGVGGGRGGHDVADVLGERRFDPLLVCVVERHVFLAGVGELVEGDPRAVVGAVAGEPVSAALVEIGRAHV